MSKELRKYIALVLFIFFIVGQACIFIIVDVFKGQFGSVADWVSGLGAVFAILAVGWQIDEQRREFNEDKNAEIKVAVGETTIQEESWKKRADGKTEFTVITKRVLRTYAYNVGYSAGSFMFIGFATKDTLEKIKEFDPHSFGNDPISQVIDPAAQLMLVPEREFEKVDSRGVSKPIDYDISLLKKNFDEGSIIYSVYMDPLGEIYYSESPIKI